MNIVEKIFNIARIKNSGIWLSGKEGEGEYKHWLIKSWRGGIRNDNLFLGYHHSYKNGELHGEYKTWWHNGQLSEHCFYKNDELIKDYLK